MYMVKYTFINTNIYEKDIYGSNLGVSDYLIVKLEKTGEL